MNKTLVLSATLENLETLIAHASSFATDNGMDPKLVYQVELSLEEVLVNVISYAYPEGTQGNVEVNCSWEVRQGLTLEVVDYGEAFDPLAKPDPDTSLSLDERSIGGLGIFLTKKMMDKVTYDRCQGKNILTLIKHCQTS
ncbi:MAG: ATP-binding protein [Proteobacteria bacterium]|nr:ATP-binding protein [Pseudomonadota bacterium]MBU4133040.1 ATP-binding protein [Pseudomonadota bacterium]